jgi:hypothetical protein
MGIMVLRKQESNGKDASGQGWRRRGCRSQRAIFKPWSWTRLTSKVRFMLGKNKLTLKYLVFYMNVMWNVKKSARMYERKFRIIFLGAELPRETPSKLQDVNKTRTTDVLLAGKSRYRHWVLTHGSLDVIGGWLEGLSLKCHSQEI